MAKKEKDSSKDLFTLYWKSNVYIPGRGTVQGEARPDDVEAFDALTRDIPGFNRGNYLSADPPKEKDRKVFS